MKSTSKSVSISLLSVSLMNTSSSRQWVGGATVVVVLVLVLMSLANSSGCWSITIGATELLSVSLRETLRDLKGAESGHDNNKQ